MLVFIVDKETDKLVACAIRKGYTYVVYKSNNISDINGNNDYIIRKIYNIIRQRIKVVYKQDIPILTLSEDYERIFLELSDIIGMIKHEYTNSTFNELINTVFIKSCDIYYLHILDITNYSSALSYKFLNSNTYKNKFITYHNELIAPYNLATEIKSLFLNIDNITNTITLASCIKDIDEENVKYNKVIANLYKISKEIYKCELINNEYKSTILKYIKRLLINKAYKKQFDDNLYNYLVPVHNKLLTIGTKYKLCSNIKPL